MSTRHIVREQADRLARAILPSAELRHLNAVRGAVQPDGRIAGKALSNVVPLQTLSWYLPGTAAVGNNQGAEYRIVQPARLRRVDVICTTAPTGGNLTIRLTNDGGVIDESVTTVQNGTKAGAAGMDHAVVAGNVLRVDIIGVGATTAGADITVQVAYLPVTG